MKSSTVQNTINTDKDLILAAQNGNTEAVEILLANGANVNQADSEGRTALMMAAKHKWPHAVELLLENSADVNQVNDNNETALTLVAKTTEFYKEGVIKQLLDAGADIDHTDKHGKTPLQISAENPDLRVIKDFMLAGFYTNFNLEGISVLHKRLILIAQATCKYYITQQPLSTQEYLAFNSRDLDINFANLFLNTKLQEVSWKYVIGKKLSPQEDQFFLTHVVYKLRTSVEPVEMFWKEKSLQVTLKRESGQKLFDEELIFFKSFAYDEDSVVKLAQATATKITQGKYISYQERKFLDKLFNKNTDLTSRAIQNNLSPDSMRHVLEFLPKKEAFNLQTALISSGMKNFLKHNSKIKVDEEMRPLSDEEMQIAWSTSSGIVVNFTSNKMLQLYHLMLEYQDRVIIFSEGEPINLEILLDRYKKISYGDLSKTTRYKKSKESHKEQNKAYELDDSSKITLETSSSKSGAHKDINEDSKTGMTPGNSEEDLTQRSQDAQQEDVVKVYALYDIRYDNPFLNNHELALRSSSLGLEAFNPFLNARRSNLDQEKESRQFSWSLHENILRFQDGAKKDRFEEEMFDSNETLSLNLGSVENLDQEKEDHQLNWSLVQEDNAFMPILAGLLTLLIADHKSLFD